MEIHIMQIQAKNKTKQKIFTIISCTKTAFQKKKSLHNVKDMPVPHKSLYDTS